MVKKFIMCCALLFSIVGCSKKSEKWEMVIHARGGWIENARLVLEDADQYVSAFTVGKPRKAVSFPLRSIVSEWDKLFGKSEPNATLSIRTSEKVQKEQVVILKKPQLVDGRLIFIIEQKAGRVEETFSDAVLFIDAIDFTTNCGPLWGGNPLSCHG